MADVRIVDLIVNEILLPLDCCGKQKNLQQGSTVYSFDLIGGGVLTRRPYACSPACARMLARDDGHIIVGEE